MVDLGAHALGHARNRPSNQEITATKAMAKTGPPTAMSFQRPRFGVSSPGTRAIDGSWRE